VWIGTYANLSIAKYCFHIFRTSSFHPKGKIPAFASYCKTIALWDIDAGKIISHIEELGKSFYDKLEFRNGLFFFILILSILIFL